MTVIMFKNLYIHFPYCLYKCHYCDFNSYAYEKQNIPHADYHSILKQEIAHWANTIPESQNIETIFFGGGTPSLMQPAHVEEILKLVDATWGLAKNVEITLETNPGTVTRQSFVDFKSAGINRISLGVQSFAEKNLQRFGRIHSGPEALQALEFAKTVFTNVSCDLIFGFPEQALADWQSDLQKALTLDLPHMSCYSLTAEAHTQYAVDVKAGKWHELPNDLLAAMQTHTYEKLQQQGYDVYEISNFAKPGFASRHNLCYWHYQSYLGLGAGATSQFVVGAKGQVSVNRRTNFKRPQDYMQAVIANKEFGTSESIPQPAHLFEYLMMHLRLQQGIEIRTATQLWGEVLWQPIESQFEVLAKEGFLLQTPTHWQVTQKGFLLNHKLLSQFFDLL